MQIWDEDSRARREEEIDDLSNERIARAIELGLLEADNVPAGADELMLMDLAALINADLFLGEIEDGIDLMRRVIGVLREQVALFEKEVENG